MNAREIEEMSWRMAEVYEAVVNRILINMARHFQYINAGEAPSGTWIYQAKKLAEMGQVNRETEQIILNMLGDADGALRALLEESILNGLKDAEPALRKAAEKGFLPGGVNTPPVLDPGQMQAFKAYYKQSADKLNMVNTVMLESTGWAYQATVADIVNRVNNAQGILNKATGEVVTGVSSWNDAIRRGVQDMVKNGITGFVDHGGHKWSPEAYVAMDVRTTMANTARAAVWERCEDYGDDLYQVSWHNAARPLCFPWQAKVISRSDTVRDVEDDEGNTIHVYAQSETTYGEPAGIFGVNCSHYPIPFVPGFSRIRQPQQDAEENEKAYEQSQKQRYLERRLREEKRDLEVMKAQGASEDELKWQRQRIRDASEDIDDFCAKTGRTRRRDRETAPVRATFPTENGAVEKFRDEYIPTNTPQKWTEETSAPIDAQTVETTSSILSPMDQLPAFTPAKSISEAESVFSEYVNADRFGAIGVSYKGVSLDVANEINRTLGGLYQTYNVEPFGGIQAPAGNTKLGKAVDGATAAYSPVRHSFLLNRKSFSSMETAEKAFAAESEAIRNLLEHPERYDLSKARAIVRETVERSKVSGRATVPTSISEALTHEFGHALEKKVKRSADWSAALANMSTYANRISGYAGASESEYIAESFASYMKGENLCDPILIQIFKSLIR